MKGFLLKLKCMRTAQQCVQHAVCTCSMHILPMVITVYLHVLMSLEEYIIIYVTLATYK